jgi:hypothetical protein
MISAGSLSLVVSSTPLANTLTPEKSTIARKMLLETLNN